MIRLAIALAIALAALPSLAGTIEEEVKRYNLEYCASVGMQHSALKQGESFPAKKQVLIKSELKKCNEVWAAYKKKYPPGSFVTGVSKSQLR
jgi:hypothetical protein